MTLRPRLILIAAVLGTTLAFPASALARDVADAISSAPRTIVVVQPRSAADAARVRAAVVSAGGQVGKVYRWGAIAVTPPYSTDATSFAAALRGKRGVRFSSKVGVVQPAFTAPNDPYFGEQWGLQAVGAPAAWGYSFGNGVNIAEMDGGIDGSHEDLQGRVVVESRYNFFAPGTPPTDADDDQSHGTHVAGIMAATYNNMRDIAGAAPQSRVWAFKVMGFDATQGRVTGDTGMLASAIQAAADATANIKIITMSLTTNDSDPNLLQAIDYARGKGLLVVAATGNNAVIGGNAVQYPAAYPGVLGVGAVERDPVTGEYLRASFSNYAPGVVDLVAPGVDIWSTVNPSSPQYNGWTVTQMNGTSMATPFVTASAALLWSEFPGLSATEVAGLLESNAQDLGPAGPDAQYGHGLVRPDLALSVARPDAFEPDDSTATARPASLDGAYAHTLFPAGDTDFHWVALTAGRTYRVETRTLLGGADTLVQVLTPGGLATLAGNDDRAPGDPSSLVTFKAPKTGRFYIRISDPRSHGGAYTLTLRDITAASGVVRLAAPTRYSTAVRIARDAFPGWAGVTDVVVASGQDAAAADPLSAAGLCGLYHAPLLLTPAAGLSPDAAAAISGMPAGVRVHIVGGEGSVLPVVAAQLAALPTVAGFERISGADRFALAAAVAERVVSASSTPPAAVLVANGADRRTFFDALALSAVSARTGFPVLLVRSTTVPPVTAARLAAINPSQIVVAGGPATVSNGVYASLGATTRWWGATRYDTALAVANGAIARGWLTPDRVSLAAKLPDALTGGASLGSHGTPVLVTAGTVLSSQARTFILQRRSRLWGVDVLGGTGSISLPVEATVRQVLQ